MRKCVIEAKMRKKLRLIRRVPRSGIYTLLLCMSLPAANVYIRYWLRCFFESKDDVIY